MKKKVLFIMLFFFFIASIFPVSLFTTVIDGDRKITNEEQQLVNRVLAERYNTYYFHSDHLGSAQLITDWRGEEYERIEYTPYGELWIEKVRDGFETINYRFTGKEMDSETGLYYFGARYLDPKYSRWLSTDPALGDYVPQAPVNDEARKANGNLPGQGGLFNQVNFHLYHYAGNNPVRYIDPDGRDIQKAIDALVKSNKLSTNTTSVISKAMIENLYKAESKRMSVLEKLGLDGTTVGRGQVGELAYTDVLSKFENEITSYSKELGIDVTKNFSSDIKNEDIEDFIVTAYLSLCINNRQKEGRSKEDAAKFGIGYYHGASVSIRKAQATNQDTLSFNGTEQALKNGNKEEKDILNYINEVMYGEK